MNKSIWGTTLKLTAASILMFGFGYALVPLYNVLCEVTGLNGKTGVIETSAAERIEADVNRLVKVQFDTNVNKNLPWKFRAETLSLQVVPGQLTEAVFTVTNLSSRMTFGRAVPSVSPGEGSIYFNKTECFCFSKQDLGPGESREMSVRFIVDPAMPDSINTLTLSYTFFPLPPEELTSVTKAGKSATEIETHNG